MVTTGTVERLPSNAKDIVELAVADILLDRGHDDSRIKACSKSVREFAKHAWLNDPNLGPIPFAMWDWQAGLLELWAEESAVCVLKARQLGVSWLVAVYVLWRALFRKGQRILLVSIGQREADKLLEKVSFVLERLPDWLRPPESSITDNVRMLRFELTDSEIESLPASGGVGRSRSASLVVLDEHAWQARDAEIWTAIKATVEHGSILSISTANGLGPLHTRIYKAAQEGKGRFTPVFIPWNADPRRDEAWRTKEQEDYELAGQGDEFVQEYPSDDVEAFIVTGSPVFTATQLSALPVMNVKPREPGLWVYANPDKAAKYVIGADTSEGVAGGDWSSACVLRVEHVDPIDDLPMYKAEQVAQLRGRWEPELFAKKLHELATFYSVAPYKRGVGRQVQLGVERNNHGHAVLVVLRQLNPKDDPYAITAWGGKLGWNTTATTRPIMYDGFAGAIRGNQIDIHDPGTISQMSTFAQTKQGGEAQSGYHDDDVTAAAIANMHVRRAFGNVIEVAKRKADR